MARESELQAVTGYPSGGVSPLGLDSTPVFVDEGLFKFSTIIVGAGEVGMDLELSPFDVQEITDALVLAITVQRY